MKTITAELQEGWQLTLFVKHEEGANAPSFEFKKQFYAHRWEAMEAYTNAKNQIEKDKETE